MSRKTHRNITLIGILIMLLVTQFASVSTANAVGGWEGDPDPYLCNTFKWCTHTLDVCINGVNYVVGINAPPDSMPGSSWEELALYYGTTLTAGKCSVGEPDPYLCDLFKWCTHTLNVCINGVNHVVGINAPPDSMSGTSWEELALYYGTKLNAGKCRITITYTGRWAHIYSGRTWTCILVSEANDDKNAPRFSNIGYVKDTCGDHELFGPFNGNADYKLCREKDTNGVLHCGNIYDTSY